MPSVAGNTLFGCYSYIVDVNWSMGCG